MRAELLFAPFHFYPFKLCFSGGVLFFYFITGLARKKIKPANMINPPKPCRSVIFSPSKTPQITATIGINNVTVEANNGVEILSKR